ncbi:MAG: site-specific integrase [Pseudomonadales bacterium]|nr:site-specific integrase [Pseudomonadales bacterium]
MSRAVSPRRVDVLSARSEHEYAAVLKVAFINRQGGKSGELVLDLERVAGWSRSRRTVLRAALARTGADVEVPEPPRKRGRKDKPIPVEDELAAYEEAARTLEPAKQAIALLPLHMGLRAAELLQLKRKDVERAVRFGELAFTRKAAYDARLPAKHAIGLWRILLAAPARDGGKWELLGEVLSGSGQHTRYCALRRLVRHVGRLAGITKLKPHSLRHGFATRMVRRGAPLPIIQKWLGHAFVSTTMLYIHPETADLEKWV